MNALAFPASAAGPPALRRTARTNNLFYPIKSLNFMIRALQQWLFQDVLPRFVENMSKLISINILHESLSVSSQTDQA
jgi:hypothetical protein